MTNNKQQTAVKLYTEEQVLNSMLSMKTYIQKYDESVIDSIVEKHLKSLGGIELPSDEEIEDASLEENNDDLSPAEEFQSGAKWMRDKIQGGSK
jgi:hypothetical protein